MQDTTACERYVLKNSLLIGELISRHIQRLLNVAGSIGSNMRRVSRNIGFITARWGKVIVSVC